MKGIFYSTKCFEPGFFSQRRIVGEFERLLELIRGPNKTARTGAHNGVFLCLEAVRVHSAGASLTGDSICGLCR